MRTKHTQVQTHTHTKTRQNRKKKSHVLCQCVFLFLHEFTDTLLSPTQASPFPQMMCFKFQSCRQVYCFLRKWAVSRQYWGEVVLGMWGAIWEFLLLAIPELPGEFSYSSQFLGVIFSTIKAVSRCVLGVCHNWKHEREKETHAASRASTCLEKDKVGASFCRCYGLCWPEILHLWLMEGVRKTILFLWTGFYKSVYTLSPIGHALSFWTLQLNILFCNIWYT